MAVYTDITQLQLEDYLKDFNIGKLVSFTGIASGVENTNYFVTTTQKTFVLTIFEKRVDEKDLPFFLNLMNHLSDKKISCPQVIKNTSGETLHTIADKPSIIISFLKGGDIKTVTADACRQIGEITARMHMAVVDFTEMRKNTLGLDGWKDLYNSTKSKMSDELASIVSTELAHQDTHKKDTLPKGIIHADLFTDNVFFENGELTGVIDFYFASTDSFAYDLAINITAWCFVDDFDQLNLECASAMLRGYQSVRPLNADEISSINTLARGASIRFLLTRYYDQINTCANAKVHIKDHSEYVRKLKFYQTFDFQSAGIL